MKSFFLISIGASLILGAIADAQCPPQKLKASDAASGDDFGEGVAISGTVAIVGSENDDDLGSNTGSAYVFERVGSTWTQVAKLKAADAAAGDIFGTSVAVDGDVALVGSQRDDVAGTDSGSAYVFRRTSPATWTQEAKFTPSDGAASDEFGWSVAVWDGIAVVGAALKESSDTGAAYVFEQVGGSWVETAKLSATDLLSGDRFGSRVAVSDNVVLVGAQDADTPAGVDAGSVYAFRRTGAGAWVPHGKFEASDGKPGMMFGSSIAIQGSRALIGAMHQAGVVTDSGAAYVFEKEVAGWFESAKFFAPDSQSGDLFDSAIALSGDVVLVGAQAADGSASETGAAYVFQSDRFSWNLKEKLQAEDIGSGSNYGHSLGLSGSTAFVGAEHAEGSGLVFVHDLAAGGALSACPSAISLSKGGSQYFKLSAGSESALMLYFVAGTASGTSPGLPVGDLVVPLNPDGYFFFTVNHPNQAPYTKSLGFLSPAGFGSARLTVPPGTTPSLVGLELDHAYLVWDVLGGAGAVFASNAVPVTFVP